MVGDVLTAAHALVSIGTADALGAVIAVGPDRVLLLAPDGTGGVETAALDAATAVGAATADLAGRLGPAAVVMVAIPGGEITTVDGDPRAVADRVQELIS